MAKDKIDRIVEKMDEELYQARKHQPSKEYERAERYERILADTNERIANLDYGEEFSFPSRSYPMDWTDDLRESIRRRDGYVCQLCGIHQGELKGFIKKLDVHHIDYNKDNLDPDNLITLCKNCHMKTNYNRNYWAECLIK